jgi:DNA repair protein RecN (Recombination protein N)
MLSALKIQNYALIQNLNIEIGNGLNIITGETGAGKSILLGALGLILGNRADTTALLNPDTKCVIEGKFLIGKYNLQSFFKANDLDWEDLTILRREITPNGKSRAFINDTPVNLNILKELGEYFVDIHSQHQTLKLASPLFQISLLDAYSGHKHLLEAYSDKFNIYKKLQKDIKFLREKEANAKKEYDFNLFQLNELDQASIQHGELVSLEDEFILQNNAETIKNNLQSATYELLEDENSIINRIANLKKQVSSIANLNPRLQQIFKRLDEILIESKDISSDIDDFQDSVFVDNERLNTVGNRIQVINNLLYKHQLKTEADLINLTESIREKINAKESLSSSIEEIEKELSLSLKELNQQAIIISANRKKQVHALENNLVLLLKQVGIPEAAITIEISEASDLTETGKDVVRILFSANKGSRPMPVGDIASGGEMSRLMLCFKYILADSIFLPTIVFDEIDTGVSGETAIKVGQMIKKLSASHQVICITHLPQVAAIGDHQYVVYKISGKDITVTNIRLLDKEERVEEIAKMIAGHKPSSIAIENAKELLSFEN